MRKVKETNIAVGPAFQAFVTRCQMYAFAGVDRREVYALEDVRAELEKALAEESTAEKALKDVLGQITGKISKVSEEIESRVADVEAAISSCDDRRKALLRISMEELNPEKKAKIEKDIAGLRTESADNQYKMELLKEKLKLVKEVTPEQQDQITAAQTAAEAAEMKVRNLKNTLLDSLDNSIFELLAQCQEVQNSTLGDTNRRAEKIVHSYGL